MGEVAATSVLFLDKAGTVLWYQSMSRVGPGYLQCRAGGKPVRAAASAIANAYAAPVFGVTAERPRSHPKPQLGKS
jgi:hypothetical protein